MNRRPPVNNAVAVPPPIIDADTAKILAEFRRALQLTQPAFARCFGIPLKTIQNWEQGVRHPEEAAWLWLSFVICNPKGAADHVERLGHARQDTVQADPPQSKRRSPALNEVGQRNSTVKSARPDVKSHKDVKRAPKQQ